MPESFERAPVRPRVLAPNSIEPLLLEDEVRRFLEADAQGVIAVLGPPGSGKTAALAHVASFLPSGRVTYLDNPDAVSLWNALRLESHRLIVYSSPTERLMIVPWDCELAVYRLMPWDTDDLIEYLLAVHRPHCPSVMARVRDWDRSLFGGLPELWRPVLDRLAADPALPDPRRALHRLLEEHLTDTDLLERARSACLNAVVCPGEDLLSSLAKLARPGFADNLIRILRHAPVQSLLAAERVAADLHGNADCDFLAKQLPRELVKAAACLIADDEEAMDHVRRLLAGPPWSHAMSASLWHATGADWEDGSQGLLSLSGAYLDGVRWPGAILADAVLEEADFSEAELSGANLSRAAAYQLNLCTARLRSANVQSINALEADLSDADLSSANGESARFKDATLTRATFAGAVLRHATFQEANLDGADFRDTDLSAADLRKTSLIDTDFAGANLQGANLSGLCLREAHWEGVCFKGVNLHGSDLEGMTLLQADLEGAVLEEALLTGSTMRAANFRGTNLSAAKLAEVDWEGACLAGADLTGATFHMGSTRSGLVGSPIACEGSRTGFYTDEYDEQTYKSPEEIRKANLCGADLRGARLEEVDFYLVDLRGALFDPKQELHLRRCGAILGAKV
jgi:uncharacterized protein YjbI with pentapeptide repeats